MKKEKRALYLVSLCNFRESIMAMVIHVVIVALHFQVLLQTLDSRIADVDSIDECAKEQQEQDRNQDMSCRLRFRVIWAMIIRRLGLLTKP